MSKPALIIKRGIAFYDEQSVGLGSYFQTTATIALLNPYEVPKKAGTPDKPWTEDGEGNVTLNVEVVPGLYYAAASAASLDDLKCPGASAPATGETTLIVAKPKSEPQGFFKVWVSDKTIEAE